MDLFAFDDLYVRRLKEHDRETEAHFHKYFRGLLFSRLRTQVRAQDIDDVVQEVFRRTWSSLDRVRDGHKFGAFVLGICNNYLHEKFRKESHTESLTEEHEGIPGKSDVEQEFLDKAAAEAVREVLRGMGGREAAVLRAVFLEDEDRDEICRRLGVTANYLRLCLHRAKEKFRAALRKQKRKAL